jgi:hypothetical protein
MLSSISEMPLAELDIVLYCAVFLPVSTCEQAKKSEAKMSQ